MGSGVNYDISAPVFNIQPYSIHDGPGIRVTVFIKGCPLRCLWCANPESRQAEPQLMEYTSRCTLCGRCAAVCPAQEKALTMVPAVFTEKQRVCWDYALTLADKGDVPSAEP